MISKVNIVTLLLSGCLAIFSTKQAYSQKMVNGSAEDYIVTKGRYYGSTTFSLDSRVAENEDQLLRQVVDQNRYDYRIMGNGGYAIKDNLTLGLKAGYGRAREEITFIDENGGDITSKRLQQGLSMAPNMRNYIPIGSGQLQVLIQTEVNVTVGESLLRTFRMDDVDKVESNFLDLQLGISPGMILFFDRHWAFETTVGVAGFSTRIEEEVTNDDQDNRQRVVETGVDLRINLLQLDLGVAYYF